MRPTTDPARLEALRKTGLLDAPREPAFDRLVRLARRLTGAPTALVTLVDADRQFFLAEEGLGGPAAEARETPLSHSLCRHVVDGAAPLVVSDAPADPRVAGSGAVTDLGVAAYLGVPLRGPGGEVIGALCAIADGPRAWDPADVEALADLADVASAEVAVRMDRRHSRAALAESQAESHDHAALLALAVGAARMGAWRRDLRTGETFWGARCREIFGVPRGAEVSTAYVESLVHPDDRDPAAASFSHALADPAGAYRSEHRLVRPDGEVRWVLSVGRVVREGGEATALVGLTADITDRKVAERSLRLDRDALERRVTERTVELGQAVARSRRLARALALVEQRERQRLGHVLHEDLQQVLFGLGLQLAAAHTAGAVEDAVAPRLRALVDRALALTRSLSHELAMPGPPDGRLDRALGWLAGVVGEGAGLEVAVEAAGPVEVADDVRDVTIHLVRELLFNVTKHAGVAEARVRVRREAGQAVVTVADDGVGFDPETVVEGLGLRGVRDRVDLLDGTCHIEAAPGEGVEVTLRVPALPRLLGEPALQF